MERHLEAVSLAVANADPRLIPPTIRWAFEDGANLSQVLTAIDVAPCLAEVPSAIRDVAWAEAHKWARMIRRDDLVHAPAPGN